jgi:glyoxylase-like metal-dependent hydrolase (beta-lactamase superfamily II)
MRVRAIQTGTVRLKRSWPQGRGHGIARQLHALFDAGWTDPLPIYTWVIEHPEGLTVVDTGETARAAQPGYFPWWHPAFRFAVRESLTPDDEIGPQLRRVGLSPDDVRWVVLTHLHTDHAGGLHHFPKARFLVARAEYQQAQGRAGQLRGYVPQHWPTWFAPELIEFARQPLGPFPASYPLTRDGAVLLVPTPGHSAGHLSVLLRESERAVAFAGDLSYSQDLLLAGAVDGVAPDERLARASMQWMTAFMATTPTVYLPSHDPNAARRLDQRAVCAVPAPATLQSTGADGGAEPSA